MKIDLHYHTKIIKSGEKGKVQDLKTEEDYSKLIKKMQNANVGILAITNHNYFDYEQFLKIKEKAGEELLILPGVEIDLRSSKNERHQLNIIVSDEDAKTFSEEMKKINSKMEKIHKKKDNYEISMDEMRCLLKSEELKNIKKIVLLPCKSKDAKGYLPKEDQEEIKKWENSHWLYETSNINSTIIMNNGKMPSIHGSDNHYEQKMDDLPDIKLKIKNFTGLWKFFKKDKEFITENLKSKKYKDNMTLKVFDDKDNELDEIKIDIFKDVNALIGAKGTGKTNILRRLEKHFIDENDGLGTIESYGINDKEGYDEKIIEPLSRVIEEKRNKNLMNKEIKELKELINNEDFHFPKENLSAIRKYYETNEANKNKKPYEKLTGFSGLKGNMNIENEKKKNLEKSASITDNFIKDLSKNKGYSKKEELTNMSDEYKKYLLREYFNIFFSIRSRTFFEKLIEGGKTILKEQKMIHSLPTEIGLKSFFDKRNKVQTICNDLLNINGKEWDDVDNIQKIGNLDDFNEIYLLREYSVVNENFKKGGWKTFKGESNTNVKTARKMIKKFYENSWMTNIKSEFNGVEEKDWWYKDFNSANFIIAYRDKTVVKNSSNNKSYEHFEPSSGQKSMLQLSKYLDVDRKIYILDEPEKSIDNNYINNIIVPKINDLAKRGKIIIISTHNANIGVATLPYNTIYREYNVNTNEYNTFSGNPFTDEMCSIKSLEKRSWIKTNSKILEGGLDAFKNRGEIYEQQK